MGDRVSIQFTKDGEKSVVLFSHWDGMEFVYQAKRYAKILIDERSTKPRGVEGPLDRFEPNTVMVDFISQLTKDAERVDSNYNLGATEHDDDNSDNGHHIIDLDEIQKQISEVK